MSIPPRIYIRGILETVMKLSSSVTILPSIGPAYAKKLEKLEIFTIEDLLLHTPFRYLDFRNTKSIAAVTPDELVTIGGQIISMKNIYTKWGKKIQLARLQDKSGTIEVIWFNQPYLINNLAEGTDVFLAGKVGWFSKKKTLISPEYEISKKGKSVHTGRLIPVYHETAGISSKWLRQKISLAYPSAIKMFKEYLPLNFIKNSGFYDLARSIKAVHFPKSPTEAKEGRNRLAFNELLFHQLSSIFRKEEWLKNEVSYELKVDNTEVSSFLATLPFALTPSQKKASAEILADLVQKKPMNRILEGDVGSGKTVVAAIASFVAFTNGYQSVFMAPTQILAQQHFETLNKLFSPFKVRVTLITSEGITKDVGKTDIFIGTHALIHRKVDFDKVALVVIDEQHRFGVEQRAHLIRKVGKISVSPHILTMTATPIPRTVALTVYGDLDLSTLTELPLGRKKIATWIVPNSKRKAAYKWIEERGLKEKAQVFIICPLIEESNIETFAQVKAATIEFANLHKLMPKLNIGLIHGKMTLKEKNVAIDNFAKNKTQILVATPVVEVGIDIPNATIMVVEGAERFGLAQLHQLRGRVGRSDKKSYCLIFSEKSSRLVSARLKALTMSLSGFELAELDLKLRGPGEVFGIRQHGFPNLKIASWKDSDLIQKAGQLAKDIAKKPDNYKGLYQMLKTKGVAPN